jgi:hypothetical protein
MFPPDPEYFFLQETKIRFIKRENQIVFKYYQHFLLKNVCLDIFIFLYRSDQNICFI